MEERVGIKLELENTEQAEQTLKIIDETLKSIGRGKTRIRMDDGDIASIDEGIKRIQDRLAVLKSAKKLGFISESEVEEMNRLNAQLTILKRGLKTGTSEARTFKQVFKEISTIAKHAGQNMQTLGNALTKISSPYKSIMNGALFGVGYKALGQFTDGIENAFDRVDTMRKYKTIMASFNSETYTSDQSIADLNKSVEGLPIALDDAVSLAQRFTNSMGDMEKGTKLAIATNNAFLASMSTDTQRYQGMMQLQDVIGGKDMNAREWQALANSMLPAIRMMAEYLGLEGKAVDEYVAKVQQGKISNEEFLDTLLKAGTDDNGRIRQVAEASMNTWEAFFSRIRTAASRLGAGIIESLDEVVKVATGGEFETVNKFLDDLVIGNGIDKMTQSVKDWINANPDKIIDFFEKFKDIDIMGIAKSLADSALAIADISSSIATAFDGKLLNFYIKALPWLSIIGKFLTIAGGLTKGLSHPTGFFGALLLGGKKVGKGGIFGKIASFFGKSKAIKTAGEVAEDVSTASPKIGNGIKTLVNMLGKVALVGGIFVTAGGAAFVVFKEMKSVMNDLKDMTDVANTIDWDMATNVLVGMATFFGAFITLGNIVKPLAKEAFIGTAIAGALTALIGIFGDVDAMLLKDTLSNFEDVMGSVERIVNKVNTISMNGNVEGMKSKIKGILDGVQEVFNAFNPEYQSNEGFNLSILNTGNLKNKLADIEDALQSIGAIAIGLDGVSKVADKVGKIGKIKLDSLGINNIGALLDSLKANLNTETLASLVASVAIFKTTLETLMSAIDTMGGEHVIDVSVSLKSGKVQGADKVVKAIDSARKTIEFAIGKIPTSYSRNISVRLNANVNTKGAISAIGSGASAVRRAANQAMTASTGGYISHRGVLYRSGGGSIFKPRGTDRIPAMLTEGEYVQRKKAVDTFGIDFMRKVNNLDVIGAMQSLMQRGNIYSSLTRQSIVNNTVNNNQRVTQIIKTSNPNMPIKALGRFAGAL